MVWRYSVKKMVRLAIAGIGVTMAMAGCTGDDKIPAAKPTAGAPDGGSVPASAQPQHQGAPGGSASGAAAQACPVTVATLEAALKASKDTTFSSIAGKATLDRLECYQTFAVLRSTLKQANAQPSWLVFGYDPATRAWKPLNGGSAGPCKGHVPDDVAKHLLGCGS
jgi:hypothetical protein